MTQIAIVVYPQFTALDFIGPYEVLRNLPGAQVRFVWHEPGPVAADSGVLLVGATHSFDETPSPDVVLVPGGPGFAEAARDPKVRTWLTSVAPTADWVASVCTGSLVLAAAGLLEGKRATSHWVAVNQLSAWGATPVTDERIVFPAPGDRVVTAAGVSAGIDLGLWLAGQIAGAERAKAIQLFIEYDPQPPFDSGHRSKAGAGTVSRSMAMLTRDSLRPGPLKAASALLWESAVRRVRR
ncbi:DJ-1/PfpI family protein [Gordonia sp. ABSL1-1]|uniref:DJ-1/PfpI family protein n=1 Tax=Gordonia sp. ABSL1-1 TaxID=3053923 RepID=UPI0025738F15|nr:DJ-1/PfpI family protein [Gordonia sp. ABSL1-1]MDL9935141.1 DJ-1/PfpI family protein [Gordonia sp. ABSL1-1]